MHGTLTERITRSLAYMLRHQPEEFDLDLDDGGWGDMEEVVCALNERLGDWPAGDLAGAVPAPSPPSTQWLMPPAM